MRYDRTWENLVGFDAEMIPADDVETENASGNEET
jgi:hypothetical protein